MTENRLYETIKREFTRIVREHGLESEEVIVKAKVLTPEEAIGNPEDKDYPLVTGAERMMQAEFRGSPGQAFTDMYGNFSGRLSNITTMDLTNNFRRAIFIASLNAVMRYLGLIDMSIHCRDEEPRECSQELVKYIESRYGQPRIAFIGFQPRMVEFLAPRFEMRVTDLDKKNTGSEKFGVIIQGQEKTQENLDWCDIVLATGTTVVNGSITQFQTDKPVIFYGITISGVAKLLGLNNFCHCGH